MGRFVHSITILLYYLLVVSGSILNCLNKPWNCYIHSHSEHIPCDIYVVRLRKKNYTNVIWVDQILSILVEEFKRVVIFSLIRLWIENLWFVCDQIEIFCPEYVRIIGTKYRLLINQHSSENVLALLLLLLYFTGIIYIPK